MRKRKDERLQEEAYLVVNAELYLDKMQTKKEQGHAIVLAAEELQGVINEEASQIAELYVSIREQWPDIPMSPKCWNQTIQLRRLQRDKEMSAKFIERVKKVLDGTKSDSAMRDALLNGFASDAETINVPSATSQTELKYDADGKIDKEMLEIIDKCVDVRNHIDGALMPKMHQYALAFCYCTGRTLHDFRAIMDMWLNRFGGIPNEKTPPKPWKVVAGFRYLHDLLDDYGFDIFNDWVRRFGIEAKFDMVSPTVNYWQSEIASRFGKQLMFKVIDTALPYYEQYGIKPWHHCIKVGDFVYAYVWDTRVVELEIPTDVFNMSDITTDYVDSCLPLICNRAEFTRPEWLAFLDTLDLSKDK